MKKSLQFDRAGAGAVKLDHEKLDVYQVGLGFAGWAYDLCERLKGPDRNLRDQLLRASQSIILNIAESSGKFPSADRRRFLQIASGSARECGAVLDILRKCGRLDGEELRHGKRFVSRIVAVLTKMIGDPIKR